MEKRIVNKVNLFIDNIQNDLCEACSENNEQITSKQIKELFKRFQNFELNKDDFSKRKRVKNIIPQYTRCCAKRANGDQCTRKRKDGIEYCGTHEKNRPHGIISINTNNNSMRSIDVWLQDINGILYYIDSDNNVYKSEDILNNALNPKIIYKYKIIDSTYYIIND